MIRFAFSTLMVCAGVALPVLGGTKAAALTTTTPSSKTGSRSIPAPVKAAPAPAKSENQGKPVVIVTSDLTRASRAAKLASQPQPAVPHLTCTPGVARPSESQAALVVRAAQSLAHNSPISVTLSSNSPVRTSSGAVLQTSADGGRLARVTAYWRGEGDYYTGRSLSATGVHLHDGHCAVDPTIIPYGSVVEIQGVGKFLAVDTGSAVISRTAAREGGHTDAERHAIVVDLYFEDRSEGERFAASAAKYVPISWWTPASTGTQARAARSLFAEEDWSKIQSKQL